MPKKDKKNASGSFLTLFKGRKDNFSMPNTSFYIFFSIYLLHYSLIPLLPKLESPKTEANLAVLLAVLPRRFLFAVGSIVQKQPPLTSSPSTTAKNKTSHVHCANVSSEIEAQNGVYTSIWQRCLNGMRSLPSTNI